MDSNAARNTMTTPSTLKAIDLHQREIAELTKQLYASYSRISLLGSRIREQQEEVEQLKQLLDQRLPADQ